MNMHAMKTRTAKNTKRLAALLSVLLAPLALGLAAQSAAAETSDLLYDSYVQCDPLWSPAYNVDDTDPAISYTGAWKFETPWQGQYHGTHHITNIGGSTASFVAPRSPYQFALGFTKMRNAGLAGIYYNNQLVRELDMYAPVTEARCALIFDSPLPPGKLTVKAVNRKNPASSGTYVNVDYVHYEE